MPSNTTVSISEEAPFVYPDFTKGFCCDEFADRNRNDQRSVDPDGVCNVRCDGSNNAFCIGPDDGINNRFLQEMLNPADALNCPSEGTHIKIMRSNSCEPTSMEF